MSLVPPAPGMRTLVDVSAAPEFAVVSVSGDIDHTTVATLITSLDRALACADNVVADLSSVSFIDSAGLCALIKTLGDVNAAGGRMGLVVNQAHFLRLLEVTHLDRGFAVGRNLEDVASMVATVSVRTSGHPAEGMRTGPYQPARPSDG